MRLRAAVAGTAVLLLLLLSGAPASAVAPPPGTYTYRIDHPDYGRIGTYSNRITREGDLTTVETQVRIAIKLAFVTVYRLEADRRETWRDGRLVAYSGVMEKNGKTTRIEGRAEGERFVIDGPKGRIVGPAGVWPANPWSPAIIDAEAIMATATGRLYEPRIRNDGEDSIEVDGRRLPARHYAIVTREPHEIWFDSAGRLLRFTTVENGDVVTLSLQ